MAIVKNNNQNKLRRLRGNTDSRLVRGQVMLITVLALSGTLLSATAISGYLMLNQIRQTTDVINSTKAVFAADSGLEWRLYKFFKADNQKCLDCPAGAQCPAPTLSNGATFESSCTSQIGNNTETVNVRSKGISLRNARAFELSFTRQLPPPPPPPPPPAP